MILERKNERKRKKKVEFHSFIILIIFYFFQVSELGFHGVCFSVCTTAVSVAGLWGGSGRMCAL